MIYRTLITVALALSIASATPVAVAAWLHGAHVTAEQGLRHTLVVAAHGVHNHASDHQAVGGTPSDAGVSLSAASSSLVFLGLWLAVSAGGLALLALASRRPARQSSSHRPEGHISEIALPPPRSRALARISLIATHG